MEEINKKLEHIKTQMRQLAVANGNANKIFGKLWDLSSEITLVQCALTTNKKSAHHILETLKDAPGDDFYKLGALCNIEDGHFCEDCKKYPSCEEILGATTGGCIFFQRA